MCKVSVLMSVYNTKSEWLEEAIESILNQTFSDFEFVIVLDKPTDNSEDIVKKYAAIDPRIKILKNQENLGLTVSLNRGLKLCSGKYVARMDADDIAVGTRFERQVAYMDFHPETAVLGGRAYATEENWLPGYECCADQELMRIRLLFRNAGVPHPTAMIRKSVLDSNGISYTEEIKKSQDYKLWTDIADYGNIEMLPDILLCYRVHEGQISSNQNSQMSYAHRVSIEQLEKLVGKVSEKEKIIHCSMTLLDLVDNDVKALSDFIDRIIAANESKAVYNQKKLKTELYYMWCQKAFRRMRLQHKFDMLFKLKTMHIFTPSVIKTLRYNKKTISDYKKAVQSFKNN